MTARSLLKPIVAVAAVVLLAGLAFIAVDAADDRAASNVASLSSLAVDMRLTPLAVRRLGALGDDFAVTPTGSVLLNLDGGFARLAPGAATVQRVPAPDRPITSLALDSQNHMLTVSGGYLGVVTRDPASIHGLVLPYDNARLAPSVRPGAVYLFGGAAGAQRLYRFTAAGDLNALLDSPEPIVAAADTAQDIYAATARQVVRLGSGRPEVVFRAPDDESWGPIVSIAVAPDGLLFVATAQKVYAVSRRRALSIVNDSGGALRLSGDRLYVSDRRRGLIYALSPASAAMFGAGVMRRGRIAGVLVVVAMIVIAVYARHESNRALTVVEAQARGYVSVSVAYGAVRAAAPAATPPDAAAPQDASAPQDANPGGGGAGTPSAAPNLLTLVFVRQAAAPDRPITITVPAGTLIRAGDAGLQRLMTAKPLTVRLARGTQTVTATVPAYCLDAFLDRPTTTADLSVTAAPTGLFGLPASSGETRELTPVRKLVNCLSDALDPFARRQDAVWLVEQGLFDMTYDGARTVLYRHWREALDKGAQGKLEDGKAAYRRALSRQNPGMSEAEMNAALAEITPDMVAAEVEQQAHDLADSNARDFLNAKGLLAGCGYEVDKLAFFKA